MTGEVTSRMYPLTFMQLLLWEGETVLSLAGSMSQLCWIVKLKDDQDTGRWTEAIRRVVAEDEVLRIRMILRGGDVYQYVAPVCSTVVPLLDFDGPGGAEEYDRWVREHVQSKLPILDSPLCWFAILRRSAADCRLFLKVHHLIADGWSITVLTERIIRTCRALRTGEPVDESPGRSFLDYVAEQTSSRYMDRAKMFVSTVLERFTGAPAAVQLLPGRASSGRLSARRKSFVISPDLRARISAFAEASHSSTYLFICMGMLVYLSLANGAEDTAIGTMFHNRLDPAYGKSIGIFAVILQLRVAVARDLTCRELVRRVFSSWKQSIQRQPGHLSLKDLTALYNRAGELFDVMVSYENHLPEELPEWISVDAEVQPVSILANFLDHPTGDLELEFVYRTDMYADGEISGIHAALMALWSDILANPDQRIGELRHDSR